MRRYVATGLTLLISCLAIMLASQTTQAYDCVTPARIMPVGDSITQGSSSGISDESLQIGYRKTLYDLLMNNSYNVDFVGRKTQGQGYAGFDGSHEGYPGKPVGYFVNNIDDALNAASTPADILLIHLGTNSTPANTNDIENVLDEIDDWETLNSHPVMVILALIIDKTPNDSAIANYNNLVETMVAGRPGDNIILVDMETGAGIIYDIIANGGDMYNTKHPAPSGYDKMAQLWYSALQTILPDCSVNITSSPTTIGVVGNAYSYDVEATGPSTAYSFVGIPPTGMTVTEATGLISWTPMATGSYPVHVRAENAASNDEQQFSVDVYPAVQVVTSPSVEIYIGQTYTYDTDATGSPVPTFSLINTPPTGMSIDSVTGVITWSPIIAGDYGVTVRASNAYDLDDQSFTLTVLSDTTPPIITLVGDPTVTIEVGSVYVDAGANATDNIDGDLTGQVSVSGSVDTMIVGDYTLSYNVMDTAGNPAATVTRTVRVVPLPDTTPPIITLVGDPTVTIEVGSVYVDAGANATDNIDGDLTGQVSVSGSVDTMTVGDYTLSYNVMDTAGNPAATVTRTVRVVPLPDTTPPIITLVGDPTVTIEVGSVYVDAGANATDNIDGDLTGQVSVSGSVDTMTVGDYTLSYNVMDTAGNPAATVTRTVRVVPLPDTTPPIITLVGDPTVTIEVGSVYVDAGANATDNIDGDLTGQVSVSGSVDTMIVGDYTLSYNVMDTAGNPAATVTRTVRVATKDMSTAVYVKSGEAKVDLHWFGIGGSMANQINSGMIWYQVIILNQDDKIVLDTWVQASDICISATCDFTPDASLLPYGLVNGQYRWWLRRWQQDVYSDWSEPGLFNVAIPQPVLPTMTVTPNQGRPTFSWQDDTNTQWYQLYIAGQDGTLVFNDWIKKSASLCQADLCSLTPDINPEAGSYVVYIRPWGPGGFNLNGWNGWTSGTNFDLSWVQPPAIGSLNVVVDPVSFHWEGTVNTTWYEIWVGDSQPLETIYNQWHLAADMGCENMGTCQIILSENLGTGNFSWYIRGWGPGGFTTGEFGGWSKGADFSR